MTGAFVAKHAELMREYEATSGHIAALRAHLGQLEADLIHLVGAARLFGETLSLPRITSMTHRPSGTPKARAYVISKLAAASGSGLRSSDIGRDYCDTYDVQLHPKTIGMTLHRLLKEGSARREGRKWFRVET